MRNTTITTLGLTLVLVMAAGTLSAHGDRAAAGTAFEAVLGPYEAIHAALAADSLDGVAANAQKIAATIREVSGTFDAKRAGVSTEKASQCQALLPKVRAAAEKLATAGTLEEARQAFGELSRPMVQWREMATGDHRPNVVFCPMAKKPWLQESDEVANPYFGSKMLRCGNIVSN